MFSRLPVLFNQVRTTANSLPPFATTSLRLVIWALIAIGLIARLSPFIDPEGRLFWQYMTEDGYLMQTVARNMAIGLGMSTAEGTIPTNGVQPLATFCFAALHFLAGGDKFDGIVLVMLFSTVVAAAAALALFQVAARVFADLRHGRDLALLAAALWFAAPKILVHTMNGLETGLYYLAILLTLNYYLASLGDGAERCSWRQRLALGLLLGITFLARNDAVFFIGGLLLAHLMVGGSAGGGFGRRLVDCLIAGVVSLVVAMPWLVNNYLGFGSIVPISGLAESFGAHLGNNLGHIPANLFEAAFLFAPIPRSIDTSIPIIAATLVGVLVPVALFGFIVAGSSLQARRFFVAGVIFTLAISAYYGLFFGAAHFVRRYTSALSPFLWLATIASIYYLLHLLLASQSKIRLALMVVSAVFALDAAAFAASDFARGRTHMHIQVIEWIRAHVADSEWVGAVQTGTLGYFHDRTINLDGKVNPEALHAKLQHAGDVRDYVLDSKINFVADWAGVNGWIDGSSGVASHSRFSREFEIVVNDKQRNLGVMRRVQSAGQ